MKGTWIAIAALGAAMLCGCVEREITVTSDPAGALVYVSDREMGRTPVTFPFTWYGDYDIVLRLPGHETLKTHADINPPWYEVPPLDLLSYLAPWKYHDRRYLNYQLKKLDLPSDERLINEADQMRARTLQPSGK